MAECKQCGQTVSVWQRDLVTGRCSRCRRAERQKAEERLRAEEEETRRRFEAENEEATRRFRAKLDEEARQRRAEQEKQLRARLQAAVPAIQQEHLKRVAAIQALENVDPTTRERLLEANRRHFEQALAALLRGRVAALSPAAWKALATICFVACVVMLFVAWERYHEQVRQVEALGKLMQAGPPSGTTRDTAGAVRLEPTTPPATRYALFFAALSGFGAIVCWVMAAGGAVSGSDGDFRPT